MISEFFLKRPRFAIVIACMMCLTGGVAIRSLPIELYPEITPPVVTVSATYPGASADVIAETIAAPIEKEVNGVEDMLYMESSSEDSSYSLTITFKTGIDPDMAQVKIQNRVQTATASLPTEVTRLGVNVSRETSNMIGSLSFFSPNKTYDSQKLSDYVIDNVKNALSRINGVGGVEVYAAPSSMRVWLNSDKMAALNITATDVQQAISSQNYQPSLGKLGAAPDDKAEMVFPLKTAGRINKVEDFKNIIVRTSGHHRFVRLGDIARVEYGQEMYGFDSFHNGSPAVSVMIKMSSGANAIETMKNIRSELKRLEAHFPKDVAYVVDYDATEYINASLKEVVETLFETFVLVVFVCWLFLQNWRTTLIPSIAIPVSLLATFVVMMILGFSINLFTLFGLVLAIGLVVDDAIVVVERVSYLMNVEKLPPLAATRQTMKEVSGALVAATLVMVAIFVPIACMNGITGKIYQQFAITISTALVFSAVNALTLSPVLCANILKPYQTAEKGILARFNRLINSSANGYARLAALFMRKISIIALFFTIIILLNGVLFKVCKTSFIPDDDQGMYVVNVDLPEGASFTRTKAAVEKISAIVQKQKGVRNVMGVAGMSLMAGQSENAGMLMVDLQDWSERKDPSLYSTVLKDEMQAILDKEIPEARIFLFESSPVEGLGQSGLDIRFQMISGLDYAKLDKQAQKLINDLNSNDKFQLAYTTFTAETPAVFINVNREKAESLNVPLTNLYSTLETYFGSMYVNDINLGSQINKVIIQSDEKYRSNVENIGNIYVPSTTGEMVPLGSLVSLTKIMSPRVIARYNQFPNATITVTQKPSVSTGEAMAEVEKIISSYPDDFSFEWSGTSYQEKNNQGQLGWLITLAVIFAYMFLVSQYESWTLPLPVLMSVAIASAGGVAGMLMMNMSLSIYGQLGIVMLVGLSSKNAILIVEFARDARAKNRSIPQAALHALRERFRPVLMTALTFILGVLPMLFATGAGANSRQAIGTPVFWGMLVGTIGGLFMIPLLYVLIQNLTEKIYKKENRKMKKAALTVIALLMATQAQAMDPMSVYAQKAPEGCVAASVGKGRMSLTDLIQIGICNNPDLNRNYMAVKSSEASLGAAKSAYLPTVDLNGTISASNYKGEYDLPAAGISKKTKDRPYSVNIALNWLLLDFGGRSAETEMMRAYMEAASFEYNTALHDIVLGINSAYLDLLSAQEVLKSAETSVASYKKSYDETDKKYKVGKAAISDLLLAKTTYLRSRLAVTEAKNTIEKNQANLARLLNLPPETKFNLLAPKKDKTSIALQKDLSVNELIKTALDLRPELKSADKSKQAAKENITAAKSKMGPTLSLYANASYTDKWRSTNPFKDGYPHVYGGEAGLALNVPLFNGFSQMYDVAKARYDYQQAVYAQKSTEDMVKNEVWSAYQDYQTASASYTINQEVLKSAEENERVSRASYRAGKETLLNLLTVQAQLASARQELITSFYTVLICKANVYRSIGKF